MHDTRAFVHRRIAFVAFSIFREFRSPSRSATPSRIRTGLTDRLPGRPFPPMPVFQIQQSPARRREGVMRATADGIPGRVACRGGRHFKADVMPRRKPCQGGRNAKADVMIRRTTCQGGRCGFRASNKTGNRGTERSGMEGRSQTIIIGQVGRQVRAVWLGGRTMTMFSSIVAISSSE